VAIQLYDDLAAVPPFNEDLESLDGPEAVLRLRREVDAADGLLLATPEYNQSLPGVLKNALDWLSRPDGESVLTEKPVAILGATSGAWGTRLAQSAMRQVLGAVESRVLPSPALYVRDAARLFDAQGRLVDALTRQRLQGLTAAFAEWIALVSPVRSLGSPDRVTTSAADEAAR
jgi:chromate reductase